MNHINEAVNTDPEPVMTPAAAYQKVLRYKAEHIRLDDFSGRIAASMLVPYPPGIPVLMPGERLPVGDKGIMGYLRALQDFDKHFPGFEHEIQGINVDENGDFWVRAIIEDERKAVKRPEQLRFKRRVSPTIKKVANNQLVISSLRPARAGVISIPMQGFYLCQINLQHHQRVLLTQQRQTASTSSG